MQTATQAAAALNGAQARYEDVAGFYDDDSYNLDDAYTDAETELMATGYVVSLAASEACPNDTALLITPADLLNTDDYHAIGRPMHELMAVMASGTLKAADAALREWRDRLPALMALQISDRADDLLRAAA
jgi:hypothetical protein